MLNKGMNELVALDNKHRFHLVHFWILGGYFLNMFGCKNISFAWRFVSCFFMCDEKLITTSQLLYVGNNDMYMEV